MMKQKVRLFGGKTCPICELAVSKLEAEKELFEYEYIDAFADETQDFCDEQEVDELPHIQYLDEKNNIIEEYVGMDVLASLRDICD